MARVLVGRAGEHSTARPVLFDVYVPMLISLSRFFALDRASRSQNRRIHGHLRRCHAANVC